MIKKKNTRKIHPKYDKNGNNDVHGLKINDLCTINSEISMHTEIKHV